MEKISKTASPVAPIYQTENYRVDVVVLHKGQMFEQLPLAEMSRRYGVAHKEHGVIAAIVEHLPGAIGIANKLQEELDQTLATAGAGLPPVLS